MAGSGEGSAEHVRLPGRSRPHAVERRAAAVPPSVDDVLRSPGRPLDAGVRSQMEARFGRDFSQVRVHSDAAGDAAARELSATAFTFGTHVGFASARYAPGSPRGAALLAHELAHVVQQTTVPAGGRTEPDGVGPIDDPSEREAGRAERVGRAEVVVPAVAAPLVRRSLWSWLGHFFGMDFDVDELQSYLDGLEKRRGIEGDFFSDNKARAVVAKWKARSPGFQLDGRLKIYLIKEMQAGATGDDDERAILDLLEGSTDADVQEIFGRGGVKLSDLNDDFHGAEWARLKEFYTERFKGGLAALQKGKVNVEFGPGAPRLEYSRATLMKLLAGPYPTSQIQLYLDSIRPAARERAIVDLEAERIDDGDRLEQAKEAGKSAEVATTRRRLKRIDVVLQHVYLGVALGQPADDLLRGTVPIADTATPAVEEPDVAPEAEAEPGVQEPEPAAEEPEPAAEEPAPRERQVNVTATLAPTVRAGTKFADAAGYEDALRTVLTGGIARLWNDLVKDRGEAVHADETKLHPMAEFEEIGNASKRETDLVFGNYRTGDALRADVPATDTTPARPGSLHDWWQTVQDEVAAMDTGQRRRLAENRVRYFLQSWDDVRELNRKYSAAPAWDEAGVPENDEAKSQALVVTELTDTDDEVTRIIEVHRGWEGMARGTDIFLQRFREPTEAEDRWLLWDVFQTLIHEYLHTLMDRDRYAPHARSLGRTSREYNTLVEGVDSLFTEVVWNNVAARMRNPATAETIRRAVEGRSYPAATFDPSVIPPPSARRYASYAEAVKLANTVGIRNLYAAFFLGEIELIGVRPTGG